MAAARVAAGRQKATATVWGTDDGDVHLRVHVGKVTSESC